MLLLVEDAGGSGVPSLLFVVVLLVGMYLLLIRPQRARARKMAQVASSLQAGSRVVTTAGLHATVVELADDGTVLLEIAPGVHARFLQQAVVQVLEEPAARTDQPTDPEDPDEPA